jgi:hypothetical protein
MYNINSKDSCALVGTNKTLLGVVMVTHTTSNVTNA